MPNHVDYINEIKELRAENSKLQQSLEALAQSVITASWFESNFSGATSFLKLQLESRTWDKNKLLSILRTSFLFTQLAQNKNLRIINSIFQFLISCDCTREEIKDLLCQLNSKGWGVTGVLNSTYYYYVLDRQNMRWLSYSHDESLYVLEWMYKGYFDERAMRHLFSNFILIETMLDAFEASKSSEFKFDIAWAVVGEPGTQLARHFNDAAKSKFVSALKRPEYQEKLLAKIRADTSLITRAKELLSLKTELVNYITHLNNKPDLQATLVNEALTEGTNLNIFFSTQRNWKLFHSDVTTSITKLRELQVALKGKLATKQQTGVEMSPMSING